jgi:hypothetical protein
VSGRGPNGPETLCLEFDSSFDEYECGGPQAFAVAHEMLRLAGSCDESAWMREYALGQVRPASESSFDLSTPFHMDNAKRALSKAQRGDVSVNPEHSNSLFHSLLLGGSFVVARWAAIPNGNRSSAVRSVVSIPTGVCNCCSRTATSLKKNLQLCGRCRNAYYCSKQCQKQDWKNHKKLCIARKNKG